MAADRPLSALLSQALVALTIEIDNALELRLSQAGCLGRLSLVVWANLMRFVGDGVAVAELAERALAPRPRIAHQLGCLERWWFVTLAAGAQRRAGWAARAGSAATRPCSSPTPAGARRSYGRR